jgi:hypothetical protein
MKTIDLFTLSHTPENCSTALENLTNMHVKPIERETIKNFINYLKSTNLPFRTDGITFDFKIEGIGEEFDILKNTKDFLINIELKSTKSESAILQQLRRKQFYLSKSCKKLYQYTYDMKNETLFYFDGEKLSTAKVNEFINVLNTPNDDSVSVKELLSPEKYLASPFNDTDKYMKSDYLLTSSQCAKKDKIINSEKNVLLTGNSGTGKTLLGYDIVKYFMNTNKRVLIVHGANLNYGQLCLIEQGLDIKPIKNLSSVIMTTNPTDYDLILLDEVQRFSRYQIDEVFKHFKCKVILSGDPKQILKKNNGEFGEEINSTEKLKTYCKEKDLLLVRLTDKVRTNVSLSEFVQGILNNSYNVDKKKINPDNVSFVYFDSPEDAKSYMDILESESEYKVLTLPTTLSSYKTDIYTQFSGFDTSFQVIGQEYTSVATLLGPNLKYDPSGPLYSSGTYYDTGCAFFQNITRTRKKLKLIILNNEEIYSRILDLL